MTLPEDLEFCRVLIEFTPTLPGAINPYQIIVEAFKSEVSINWSNIRTALLELYKITSFDFVPAGFPYDVILTKKDFEKIVSYVISLIDTSKCTDMSVIANVLEFACLIRNDIHSNLNINRFSESQYKGINNQSAIFEKAFIFSYKNISSIFPPISEFEFRTQNWVDILTVCGEVDLLKIIISYGATLILPRKLTFPWMRITEVILGLYGEASFIGTVEEIRAARCWRRKLVYQLEGHSMKRLYLVSVIMCIFFKKDFHARTDEYLQSARIFINSTPESLITSDEIKSLFTKFFSEVVSNDQVLLFLKEYEFHFPESRESSTPRTLEHLSRFQVRECLRTARSFPHGVKSLCIPKKIQDYICLKDILF